MRLGAAVVVEQLLGPVAVQPLLECLQRARVLPGRREGDLVGTPRALDRFAIDGGGTGPALRGPQHQRRPCRQLRACGAVAAEVGDVVDDRVEGGGQRLVDLGGIVAFHDVGAVAVAAQQILELCAVEPGEDRRAGDLPAVEVQDRKHRAVTARV